jgi:hypothetical protein
MVIANNLANNLLGIILSVAIDKLIFKFWIYYSKS